MEPVSAFLILVLASMSSEISTQEEKIEVLEERLDDVEQNYYSLVGQYAALGAQNKVEHAELAEAIKFTLQKVVENEKDIFYVEEKIKVLHP